MSTRNYRLTRGAEADLLDIVDFIAQESYAAAERVRDEFDAAFEQIVKTPGFGHYREDLLDRRHRFTKLYSYLIVYRWEESPLQVVAIVHGARDLRPVLRPRDV